MRWLHCSDFHIGKDRTAQERLLARIIDHVKAKVDTGFVPDFVFITGDITNRGLKNEYRDFRNGFLNPLREALGGASWSGRILAVPGNHDVDRTKNDNFDRLTPLSGSSQFFEANRLGKTKRDILSPRFKAYRQGAVADLSGDWITTPHGAFAETASINGVQVGIVGINTAWLSMDDRDQLKLTPGVELVEAALERVKDCPIRFVLGHHPLAWLHEEHARRLRALFGHHRVIYLHGHLHKAEGSQEDGAGESFLVLQSGSAFQARDGEPWRNGLLWGEIDIRAEKVKLAPYFWNPDNYDWPVETGRFPEKRRLDNTDWWAYPLPRLQSVIANTRQWSTPNGWELLTVKSIDSKRRDITIEEAERFFNGGEPDWGFALCPQIPHRAVVTSLVNQIVSYRNPERPLLMLLTGPGGEGKSLALRQTLAATLELNKDINILWHVDELSPLPIDNLTRLPKGPWIIATDNADLVARSLFEVVKKSHLEKRTDIIFLLCSRDTDWRATKSESIEWSRHADHRKTSMSGLTEDDALLISTAWSSFEGSGKSSKTADQIRESSRVLFDATQHEAEVTEGSLLGGILAVRLGTGLRPHVARLIDRLGGYQLPSGRTLLDAFVYIAAMHAEGLGFMSRPVLAKVLGCDSRQLGQQVMVPLAREAAVSGGSILLTRHRRIAEAAIAIMKNEFGEDIACRFEDLARAAKAARPTEFILEYSKWEYSLPNHFLETSPETAVRVARALVEVDIKSAELAINLASIYRGCGAAASGAEVLSRFEDEVGNKRGFWFEWATCSGASGDQSTAAVLSGWSIADQAATTPPDIKQAKLGLSGIGFSFSALYEQFNNRCFLAGLNAIVHLGMQLPLDAATKNYFTTHKARVELEKIKNINNDEALEHLQGALISAWEVCNQQALNTKVTPPYALTFEGLAKLINR